MINANMQKQQKQRNCTTTTTTSRRMEFLARNGEQQQQQQISRLSVSPGVEIVVASRMAASRQVASGGGAGAQEQMLRRSGEQNKGSGDQFEVSNNFCYFQDEHNSRPRSKRNLQQQAKHFHGSQLQTTTTTRNDATPINCIGERASATLQTLLVLAADDARNSNCGNKSIVRLNVQQSRQQPYATAASSASSSSASSRCGGGGGGGGQSISAATVECSSSSSGFSSEASSSTSVSARTSRLLDDLNRLERIAAGADFRSAPGKQSPVESIRSSRMPAFSSLSTTTNGEFDYSTLCRDEFSSFIPYDASPPIVQRPSTKQRRKKHHHQVGGPVLVGVHECDTPTRNVDSSSSSSSSPSAIESSESNSSACSLSPVAADFVRPLHDDRLSSGQSSSSPAKQETSDDDDDEIDREIVVCHSSQEDVRKGVRTPQDEPLSHEAQVEEFFSDETDDDGDYQISSDTKCTKVYDEPYVEPPVQLAQLCGPPEEQRQSSRTLDVYLKRVESLLRLAQGDKSISWRHLEPPEHQIQVSAEFLTPIEFVDYKSPRVRRPRVVQEIETTIDETDERRESCVVFRHVHENCDFRSSLAATEHTSAPLNWWPAADDATGSAPVAIDSERARALEEMFLVNWTSGGEQNSEQRQLLVKTIRRHMREFIESYNNYQLQLTGSAEFATDWHANWQFATGGRKRSAGDDCQSTEKTPVKRFKVAQSPPELLSYATLIMAQYKPVKLTTTIDDELTRRARHELDEVYELRSDEEADELSWTRRVDAELRPVDVCRLLLNDSFACQPEGADRTTVASSRRPLEVSYESSLNASCQLIGGHLKFSSHGHVFELRRVRVHARRKLEALKFQLLERLRAACCSSPRALSPESSGERVKFVLPVESVELSHELPVIQFCAKIAGALPINCAWFCLDPATGQPEQLHEDSSTHALVDKWPLTMDAHFDLRRGNFRFRRARDELLLELLEPRLEHHYNRKYTCVIQNYCSRAECEFELRHRAAAPPPEVAKESLDGSANRKLRKPNKGAPSEDQDAGRAILRTWSQRTLKRPPTIEADDATDEQAMRMPFHTQHATVGRLSSLSALNEDKFGINYPYHPECLRRRLEENKSCLTLRSGTIKRYLRSEMSKSDAMQQQCHRQLDKLQFEELRVEGEQMHEADAQVTFMRPSLAGAQKQHDDGDEKENCADLKLPQPRQRPRANQQVEQHEQQDLSNHLNVKSGDQQQQQRQARPAKPSLPPKISLQKPISKPGNSHIRSTNEHEQRDEQQVTSARSSSAVRSLISRFEQ